MWSPVGRGQRMLGKMCYGCLLTIDFEQERIGHCLALVVESGALVAAAMCPMHLLDDQRLIGQDDATSQRGGQREGLLRTCLVVSTIRRRRRRRWLGNHWAWLMSQRTGHWVALVQPHHFLDWWTGTDTTLQVNIAPLANGITHNVGAVRYSQLRCI